MVWLRMVTRRPSDRTPRDRIRGSRVGAVAALVNAIWLAGTANRKLKRVSGALLSLGLRAPRMGGWWGWAVSCGLGTDIEEELGGWGRDGGHGGGQVSAWLPGVFSG